MALGTLPCMKVLILCRRCIKHPERGGAEIYTMELAKAVMEKGGKVEWFASKPSGLKEEEVIEGVKFIRKGNELTTHFYGLLYALRKPKDWLLLDEFNGIGYFTFFMDNSLLLIHQLYQEFWTAQMGFWGYPFKIVEKQLLKLYKRKEVITVSPSTQEDLKSLGFEKVRIIYNGLDIEPLEDIPQKAKNLTLVYLGRLKKTKNPEDAIKAFLTVKEKVEDAELFVAGDGPLRSYLESKYKGVRGLYFMGYLTEKYQLLKTSHILLVPSLREGWGQVVLQANAVGTPAIGYKVKGLKDSIKDGETGFLVENAHKMAQKVLLLWRNKELYQKLSRNALSWARNFSWEKTRKEFIEFLEGRT